MLFRSPRTEGRGRDGGGRGGGPVRRGGREPHQRRPDRRLAKDTMARLAFMSFGRADSKLTRTMHERFFDLTRQLTVLHEEISVTPLGHLLSDHLASGQLAEPATASSIIGLAPGAQWDSKRWPETHYARLVSDLRIRHQGEIKIFLGPREEDWFAQSELAEVIQKDEKATLVRVPDLIDVAKQLATCKLVVTNDSGILHLAESVGTPVLAFYGPTVREFGYFPLLEKSQVLEHDLSCRPCSRNGKRPCHRGDLACLEMITPEKALRSVETMLAEGKSS